MNASSSSSGPSVCADEVAAILSSISSCSSTRRKAQRLWFQELRSTVTNLVNKYANTAEEEHFVCFQINITIKRLWGDSFTEALLAHAAFAYQTWQEQPSLDDRKTYLLTEFGFCQRIGWTDLYANQYMSLLHDIIDTKVEDLCKGDFQNNFLVELNEWTEAEVLAFAAPILTNFENIDDPQHMMTTSQQQHTHRLTMRKHILTRQELTNHLNMSLYKSISTTRAKELFEMVADFPDSMVAIKELKEAATASSSMATVGKIFRTVICKRLLHTGAATSQILLMYVSMIRALRVLDSSDLLLNYVAAPIREYLMRRRDTVRCIVSSLTAKGDELLHGELRKGGSLEYGVDEDDEEKGPGECWEPRKRDPDLTEAGVRGLDVLALLVSIYGSSDLFVSEYRSLLADKLLTNLLYDTDQELATMELLKLRFGEEPLHACEVMLRDLEESKRTNNGVVSELKKTSDSGSGSAGASSAGASSSSSGAAGGLITMSATCVDCVTVSDNYWPALQSESFTHHPTAVEALTQFQAAYHILKKPRKLHLSPQLGLVELELDFDDGSTRTFCTGPVQASLIMHVVEAPGGCQHSKALSIKSEMEEEEVRKKMVYWLGRGVVKQSSHRPHINTLSSSSSSSSMLVEGDDALESDISPDSVWYIINEDQALLAQRDLEDEAQALATGAPRGQGHGLTHPDEDDALHGMGSLTSAGVSADNVEKATLETFERYIRGMLTSHESMSLERLHSMLRMVACGGAGNEVKFDMNLLQLRRFMQTLVDKEKIEMIDNVYKLRK